MEPSLQVMGGEGGEGVQGLFASEDIAIIKGPHKRS